MLGAALRPSFSTRCSLTVAAAIALILPPPARCISCTITSGDCSQCAATSSSQKSETTHSCCQTQAKQSPATHSPLSSCQQVDLGKCACKMQPVERTGIAVGHKLTWAEPLAALPPAAPAIEIPSLAPAPAGFSHADLPPPLPHRILHCSWII